MRQRCQRGAAEAADEAFVWSGAAWGSELFVRGGPRQPCCPLPCNATQRVVTQGSWPFSAARASCLPAAAGRPDGHTDDGNE